MYKPKQLLILLETYQNVEDLQSIRETIIGRSI
jgi:hypothetical protein